MSQMHSGVTPASPGMNASGLQGKEHCAQLVAKVKTPRSPTIFKCNSFQASGLHLDHTCIPTVSLAFPRVQSKMQSIHRRIPGCSQGSSKSLDLPKFIETGMDAVNRAHPASGFVLPCNGTFRILSMSNTRTLQPKKTQMPISNLKKHSDADARHLRNLILIFFVPGAKVKLRGLSPKNALILSEFACIPLVKSKGWAAANRSKRPCTFSLDHPLADSSSRKLAF